MPRKLGVYKPVLFIEFDSADKLTENKEGFKGRCHFDILLNGYEKKNYSRNAKSGVEGANNSLALDLSLYPQHRVTSPFNDNYKSYYTGEINKYYTIGKLKMEENPTRKLQLESVTDDKYQSFTFSVVKYIDMKNFFGRLTRKSVETFLRKDFLSNPNQEPIPSKYHISLRACRDNFLYDNQRNK